VALAVNSALNIPAAGAAYLAACTCLGVGARRSLHPRRSTKRIVEERIRIDALGSAAHFTRRAALANRVPRSDIR